MSRDYFKDICNVKFIVELGESDSEVVVMLKAVYDNQTMRSAGVYKLIKKFREGRMIFEKNGPRNYVQMKTV